MEQVEQIFNPPLHLCLNSHDNVVEISKRLWNCEENHPICEQQVQKIGYIGQAQIEEVWKHYYKEYYMDRVYKHFALQKFYCSLKQNNISIARNTLNSLEKYNINRFKKLTCLFKYWKYRIKLLIKPE